MAVSWLDKHFRTLGERFFGEIAMDQITNKQVEEARCAAMAELNRLTSLYGKQKDGTAKDLFCNYIFENFM